MSRRWSDAHGPDYATDEPEFMAQYGRALAEWGNVEHALSHLFAVLMRPASLELSRGAFLAVPGLRDKVLMLGATAEIVFARASISTGAVLLAEWQRLRKAIETTGRNRNRLAHMHVWHGSRSGSGTFGAGHMGEVNKLPWNWEEREKQVVTIKTLTDFRQGFFSLYERISTFRDKVEQETK